MPTSHTGKKTSLLLTCLILLLITSNTFAFNVSTSKQNYAPGEPIQVNYRNFATITDWITVVKAGTPQDQYAEWYSTQGNQNGTLNFKPLAPGRYGVRGYCCWQPGRPGHGGYNIKTRFSFTVLKGDTPATGGICRDLRKGEPHYSEWSRCCDIGDGKSDWTHRLSKKVTTYSGTCRYWGIIGR